MTDERRQDVIVFAAIVSLALHAALMFFIRPQVMTHVAPGSARPHQRGPMKVQEAQPPPEMVKLEVVRDIEAIREAPEAEAEGLLPATMEFSAPEKESLPVPPALPVPEAVAQPAIEVAPFMSEKIHVENVAGSTFSTPIAENNVPLQISESVVPDVADPLALPAAEVPMFTAPAVAFTPAPVIEREVLKIVEPPKTTEPKQEFKPEPEVLATVDEKVVEEEKKAVRDLLDVPDAKELSKFVNVAATSASENTPDGKGWLYFRVRVSPQVELETVPKDVVILLDASGSIGDDRLKSCRTAARKILRSCTNTGDRFNLVAFRDRFQYAFKSWQNCDQAAYAKSDKWLDSLAAHGRTDVFDVIRSVLTLPRDPTRPLVALVVTDGDANTGVSKTSQILSKFTALNDGLISVYMYGVKESANRELIDVLTHGNRGESFIYGGPRWRAGTGIETLSEKFRDPVLSDLRILFTASSKAEAYPQRLKNLYRGESVDIVGRVPKGTTKVAFSVKGLNGSKSYEGFFKIDLASVAFDPTLPAHWRLERGIDEKLR